MEKTTVRVPTNYHNPFEVNAKAQNCGLHLAQRNLGMSAIHCKTCVTNKTTRRYKPPQKAPFI